jgi:hypothetical protein
VNGHTQFDDVSVILNALCDLEGSTDFTVTHKRFPRLFPRTNVNSYEEKTYHFPAGDVPDWLIVPPDVEDVIVKIKGVLDRPNRCDAVVNELSRCLSNSDLSRDWDMRIEFRVSTEGRRMYELTVFTNPVCREKAV